MESEIQKLNLCLNCRRRLRTCVCEKLKSFDTDSRFVILMHPMEYKKEKVGTGRFTHLILKNSLVFVDVSFDQNQAFQKILQDPEYKTFILYPGDRPIDLSADEVDLGEKKSQFIIIDGTWPCAKKMMKLTTCLHSLPRVSFKTDRLSEFKVKHQPLPGCLSTVESVHQLILDLNRLGIEKTAGAEENLMDVFRSTVEKQIELSLDPERRSYRQKPFTLPENRKISKKYLDRLIFFRSNG